MEESRAYLQQRLVVLSKAMFGSVVLVVGFMVFAYEAFDFEMSDGTTYRPDLQFYVYLLAAVGLVMLVVIWRGLLERIELSMKQLEAVDAFYVIGTGAAFAGVGVLAYNQRASAYLSVTYACLLVLLRATIVPSTGARTAVVSALACLPMAVGTVFLVYLYDQDVPGPVYVMGGVLLCAMATGLATLSSATLYSYRRKMTEAMQLGQYTLDSKIGQGGNGAVYRARHALLRRKTAIKLIQPHLVDAETLDRFEREVQHMSQLTHANTVAVFDYGRSPDGVFYYAMEYLDGIDLENLVRRFGRQPAERVVPVLVQVCGALQEAHNRGLIHRDIKPANIILGERGDVPDVAKVVDFGLVKEIAGNDGRTSTRGIMGTPSYIAPEIVTDPDAVTPAADLYALGCVGYYMLTGQRVFDGKTSIDVCVQHVTKAPTPPSRAVADDLRLPAGLEDIILGCLAKEPTARPASASELAKQLRAVPLGDAWGDERARQWWEEFRRAEPETAQAGDASTRTVTIDLELRTPVAERGES